MSDQRSEFDKPLKCREPGCPESVVYRRKIVLGLRDYRRRRESATKVIYLTCSLGHTHRYEVST